MDFISGQVVPFLARLVLGLFLAGFAAGIGYLGAWVIVISFFEVTPGITDAMAIAGIGISAGAIGSLAWIAELSGLIQGAVVAANVAPMLVFYGGVLQKRLWPPEPWPAQSLTRRSPRS